MRIKITAARGKVQHCFQPHLILDQISGGPGAHTHLRQGRIGDIQQIRPGILKHPGPGQHGLRGDTL